MRRYGATTPSGHYAKRGHAREGGRPARHAVELIDGRHSPLAAPDPTLSAWSCRPGLSARVELTVTDADTAQTLGSGDVPVLGTPRIIALAEAASVAATAARLNPGSTTVGTRIELDHQAASAVGRRITVLATLSKIDGRRLVFDIVVRDGPAQVAEGRVERVIVDRQRFVAKAFDPA